MLVNVGLKRLVSASGLGGARRTSTFSLDAMASLVPGHASGSTVPTFTRATTATVADFEGRLVTVPSGAARFQGFRGVYNVMAGMSPVNKSDDVTTLGQVDGGGSTPSANQITFTASNGARALTQSGNYIPPHMTSVANTTWRFSADVWVDSGTKDVRLDIVENGVAHNYTAITATTTVQRFTMLKAFGAAAVGVQGGFQNDAVGVAGTIRVARMVLEQVTGQSNQNPSEYVSVGVLSAPYHGAGIDGAKWFTTQNGNTVASNVVTEAAGAAIAAATLKGYLSEGAGTQILATADIRDMTTGNWTLGATMTRARTSVGYDGVASTANRITGGAVAATNIITTTITAAATSRTYSAYVKRVTGTGTVRISQDNFATNTDITSQLINGAWVLIQLNQTQLNAVMGFKIDTSTDAIDVDVNQFESGPVASSRMLATGAARNADIDGYATSGNIPASGAFVIAGEFTPNTADTSIDKFYFSSYSDANNNVRVDQNAGAALLRFVRFVGGVPTLASIAFVPVNGVTCKYSVRFSPVNGLDIWLNGTKGANSPVTTQPVYAATIEYGGGSSAVQPYAALAKLTIYATDLSDSQCAALSS